MTATVTATRRPSAICGETGSRRSSHRPRTARPRSAGRLPAPSESPRHSGAADRSDPRRASRDQGRRGRSSGDRRRELVNVGASAPLTFARLLAVTQRPATQGAVGQLADCPGPVPRASRPAVDVNLGGRAKRERGCAGDLRSTGVAGAERARARQARARAAHADGLAADRVQHCEATRRPLAAALVAMGSVPAAGTLRRGPRRRHRYDPAFRVDPVRRFLSPARTASITSAPARGISSSACR